ncbi:hypothetical protein, partial [Vibrio cholerae]|uniref:hypothetical protein n=1 Tax=Vibrio cholerae TaxID=666 RepID=UPI0019640528
DLTVVVPIFHPVPNARLRGWQRITQNSNTPTVTTAAQWDWKRSALTVPLEAFVMYDAPTIVANVHGLAHFSECKYYVSA